MKNKDEKLIFRCFSFKKNCEKELIERFANIMNFAMETLINLCCY